MGTTRAYPLDRPCQDCGARPTRTVRSWVNGMPYRVCKEHAKEYRGRTLRYRGENAKPWTLIIAWKAGNH